MLTTDQSVAGQYGIIEISGKVDFFSFTISNRNLFVIEIFGDVFVSSL